MERPRLFEKYPQLEKTIPWVPLGTFPTPVQRLDRLGGMLGHHKLWIKRDDLSSDQMGGNKVRVMEFLLAQMRAQGKQVAISPGALGSNQILASAIYGHQLGLKIVGVFFKQCETDYMCKHMLIDQSMGVEFVHVNNPYFVPFAVIWQLLKNADWKKFELPFYIPSFGSSATCAFGYFNAMLELKDQIDAGLLPPPDYIFVTAGTGGTMAGIELGARALGLPTRVVGVRITDYIACNERLVASIVNRAAKALRQAGADLPVKKCHGRDVTLIHDFFGGEYAKITPEAVEARKTCAELEGLTLDTTYTAKTMAAMIQHLKAHGLKDQNVLFWHTYNTRDLSPFLSPDSCPEKMPAPFQGYFKKGGN
ncbi:MAG TPA: pyridoxal-phosphate dependent enzyme [bacterium]|nr:pyridoxal-phosphate dependent enzyme [bacterium]